MWAVTEQVAEPASASAQGFQLRAAMIVPALNAGDNFALCSPTASLHADIPVFQLWYLP